MVKLLRGLIFLALMGSTLSFAATKRIALTLDDLPFIGDEKAFHLNMILQTLKEKQVPATGFIIAQNINAEVLPILQQFKQAGLGLGNHSYSHASASQTPTDVYINQQIDASDNILSSLLTSPKYFRFPYLSMGAGDKKQKILNHLAQKNYRVAPITVDSQDFVFNQLLLTVREQDRRNYMTVLKPAYINFVWAQTLKAEEENNKIRQPERAQILLVHANLLNAYSLADLIDFYQKNGYTFVSLQEALSHAA